MDELPIERLPIEEAIRMALRHMMDLMDEKAPGKVARAILYGSVARGDAGPGSDVDVLVVWRGELQEALDVVVAATTRVFLETGIDIRALPVTLAGHDQMQRQRSSFYKELDRDGIVVAG